MEVAQAQDLGRYHLIGVMASGGMAQLNLAVMTGIEGFSKVVAIKRVLPYLAGSPEFIEMFLNEARLAAKLDHPHIVKILELGEINNQYFMSMEYLPGEDLARILTKSRKLRRSIPMEAAAAIVQCAADALQSAHSLTDETGKPLGLVHRDVNPANIILTYHGTAKLVDFGIAKATTRSVRTGLGVFKGKLHYAAPEQIHGEEADSRTDVFSLGIVLWELLTVRRLFKGNSAAAILGTIQSGTVPPPSSIRADIPRELDQITLKALSKARRDRFQSAAEMHDALEEVLVRFKVRPTSKHLSKWLEGLFGKSTAELKKSMAQGSLFEQGSDGKPTLAPETAVQLGIRLLPSQVRHMTNDSKVGSADSSVSRSRSSEIRAPSTSQSATGGSAASAMRSKSMPRASWSTDFSRGQQRSLTGSVSMRTGSRSLSGADTPRPTTGSFASGSMSNASSFASSTSERYVSGSVSGIPATTGDWSNRGTPNVKRSAMAATAFFGLSIACISVGVVLTQPSAQAVDKETAMLSTPGELSLVSDPPGAFIFVNGDPTGLLTPTILRGLPTDKPINVRIEKSEFESVAIQLNLEAHQVTEKSFTLKPSVGLVHFEGIPARSRLMIDDQPANPAEDARLPVGAHDVRLEIDGEVVESKTILVQPGAQSISFER